MDDKLTRGTKNASIMLSQMHTIAGGEDAISHASRTKNGDGIFDSARSQKVRKQKVNDEDTKSILS